MALHDSIELALWRASELQWGRLGSMDGVDEGWSLFRGAQQLARGSSCPSSAMLSSLLNSHGTPRLRELNAFIAAHPQHLEARRLRYGLISGEGGNAQFEALTLSDALVLLEPFRTDHFHPTDTWVRVAPRAIHQIEAHLKAWPSSAALWCAWLDWNSLMSTPLDATAFRRTVSVPWGKSGWDSRDGIRVAMAVARHLATTRRWNELHAWCGGFSDVFQSETTAEPRSNAGFKMERRKLQEAWAKCHLPVINHPAQVTAIQPIEERVAEELGPAELPGRTASQTPEDEFAEWQRVWGPRGMPESEYKRWQHLCDAWSKSVQQLDGPGDPVSAIR